MGYARALLQKDVRAEEASLQKKAKKKSLWGSIGRTLGGLAATAFTGGAAAPWAAGLMAGGGSLIGGAIGSTAGGKLTGGKFFQEDRKSLQRELGGFGSQNIVESLKGGITAGIGQKLKLMKSGQTAAKGLDFQGSMVGKGMQKVKTAKLGAEYTEQGLIDPNLQGSVADGGAPIVAMDRRIHGPAAKSARIDKMLQGRGPLGSAPSIEDIRGSGSGGSGFADLSTQPKYGSGGKSLWEKFQTEDN